MNKEKRSGPAEQVFCDSCRSKKPVVMRGSDFLVLVREKHYDLAKDGVNIDNRLVGTCAKCLDEKNHFQKRYAIPVDANHPDLVRKNI